MGGDKIVKDKDEFASLRSQFVTLKRDFNIKYPPYAFAEQDVAMLSSVLNSKRAIEVNILIMRAFVRLQEAMASSKELARRLNELEKRIASQDESIRTLFKATRQLMAALEKQAKKFGFHLLTFA